jgi:hypothetical protein
VAPKTNSLENQSATVDLQATGTSIAQYQAETGVTSVMVVRPTL